MSEVLQRVRGVVERARGLRRVCPDGPLWDRVAGLQLELAELEALVLELENKGAGAPLLEPGRALGRLAGKMAAANDHSLDG